MSDKRPGRPSLDGYSDVYPGADIAPEAAELGAAMDRYKRLSRRPFPTLSEVLQVAHALGYRKVHPAEPLPARADDRHNS